MGVDCRSSHCGTVIKIGTDPSDAACLLICDGCLEHNEVEAQRHLKAELAALRTAANQILTWIDPYALPDGEAKNADVEALRKAVGS